MPAKHFLTAVFATSIIGLCAVAAINYTVDVSGIYSSSEKKFIGSIEKYTKNLVTGHSSLVKPDVSERLIKHEVAKHYDSDCYIIGSSHEMTINPVRMPALASRCSSFFNLASSGGGFEDALIMLDALSNRANGKIIIIGIGPWFFKRNIESRWQELGDSYQLARTHLLNDSSHVSAKNDKIKNLINGHYLMRNIEFFFKKDTVDGKISISTTPANSDALFLNDGSMTYSNEFIEKTKTDRRAPVCYDYKISTPFVQQQVVDEFVKSIEYLSKRGAKLAFLLMPYHPGVYGCGNKTPDALREVEKTARELGRQLDIPVWAGYDPRHHGMTYADFYDYMHVDADSLYKVRLEP